MKKTLSAAVALSVLAAPAIAANLENPLYMPSQGSVYSKTSAGVMYKITDDTAAMKAKDHDGATEFPIWRLHEELGYGILDNLEAYAKLGYTHDGDIDRKGMHLGRAGLKYRALEMSGYVWDLYADAQLGGISEMSGAYTATGFDYDNYEPFYPFFFWLAHNFKTLYLHGVEHSDGISTILHNHDGKPFLYHSWWSRVYNTDYESN